MVEGLDASVIGKKVKVHMNNQEVFEGVVFSYDSNQKCLALFDGVTKNNNRQSLKMVNASFVEKVVREGDENHLPEHYQKAELPKIDTQKLQDKANAEREKRSQNMGKNVTIEAQDVFDAISRTLKSEWKGTSIIILDTVILSEPYTADKLKPKDASSDLSHRVESTLEQVRKILKDRSNRLSQAQ